MKDFKKYYTIPAHPEEVYAALTHEPTIMLWTGAKAIFKAEPQSEFSLWDGDIVGKNLEFDPGKKIVQEWFFGDEQTTPSIVTLKLHLVKGQTSLEVNQTNIPDEAFEDITEGWTYNYIQDLIEFYEED